MHGPTCIVWANLTTFSLKDKNFRLGPTTSAALAPALARHHAGPKLPLALAPGGAAAELGLEEPWMLKPF